MHFMTVNNIYYATEPDKNASPEQMRFMVCLDDDLFFASCSDRMLSHLINDSLDHDLLRAYADKWHTLVNLVYTYVPEQSTRRRILGLCRYKFREVLASPNMIPSRLLKRFVTMFLTLGGISDPHRERRRLANERAFASLKSRELFSFLQLLPRDVAEKATTAGDGRLTLAQARFDLDMMEMTRLMLLAVTPELWNGGKALEPGELAVRYEACSEQFSVVRNLFHGDAGKGQKILYLPDTSGGLIFDLLFIRSLLRQGHKVVLALKEGFFFDAPSFWDWDYDSVLSGQLREAHFVPEARLGKNELIRLQQANGFLVISDGTREELNLYRVSVTFARAWKEADLIIAKGAANSRRLLRVGHEFTRDILCYYRDAKGVFRAEVKPKPARISKFSETGISAMARNIINQMRKAKQQGNSVMFYSAIIGSIPGQTATALKVVDEFVDHLRERLDKTFIINPGEHFVEGMDADDLMFMWEKVQRSGLIDVWRFQTVADIEKSFELMGQKVPSFWTGKDSTYSTGCTKEMHIALDVQKTNPEMQIIGPSPDKFFRRREYGVGKFCDSAIDCQ
ncbi:MAG: ARMT1-like domain-containing protein [Desulfovibrio sp.]|uniref:ARMT1-like domain-containing protein n=1 Tax=Desulfovibrio sp. 7SRBS1 TaxID=3378064 RepID=UPI003B3BF914